MKNTERLVLGATAAAAMAASLALVAPLPAAAAATPAAVTRLAPSVYLYSSDDDRPYSATDFIARSSLSWTHDGGCGDHTLADTGDVDAAKLGSGGYGGDQVESNIPFCSAHGKKFHTNDDVAPYNGDAGHEGYFLNLDNDYRHGTGTSAPTYYQYKKHAYVTYWFFYGNNNYPIGEFSDHEGDWEHVSIQLDAGDKPVTVAYFEHDGYCTMTWKQAPKKSGRLLSYSAQGSHADYPTAGGHGFLGLHDTTDKGPLWTTGTNLTDVTAQPWWGYGGGWGEVGDTKLTTGPTGPSPYRDAAPSDWTANRGRC